MMERDAETNGAGSPYAVVDAKLRAVGKALPAAPLWFDAWAELSPSSPEEDRLAVYQAIRRSGILPEEASFWLVSHVIDDIASQDSDGVLGEYEAQLRVIEEQHGFDDIAIWPRNAVPAEYVRLQDEYYRVWDALFAQKLEEFGEQQMAHVMDPPRGNAMN